MRDLDGEFRELPSDCVRGPERVRGNSEDWGKEIPHLEGEPLDGQKRSFREHFRFLVCCF